MRVRLRNGYTRAYAQIMQHTHTHKAVTGRVEAKKLLSRWRQSNYSRSTYLTKSKTMCLPWKYFYYHAFGVCGIMMRSDLLIIHRCGLWYVLTYSYPLWHMMRFDLLISTDSVLTLNDLFILITYWKLCILSHTNVGKNNQFNLDQSLAVFRQVAYRGV